MALTQPVWSRVDEAQHTDFIIQLSHGVYPLADRTIIDRETLRLMQSTGVFRFESPGSYPTPDVNDIGPAPDGLSARANAVWMSRHIWQLSYESAQPPGYYVLMVPFWWIASRAGGTLAAVYVMRVINALLIALLAPMAVVVASRLAPHRREIAVLAALFAVLLPGLALNGTRVSNDALSAVLGGLVIVLAVGNVSRSWTWRRAALAGLTLGVGLLVKVTLIGVLPALALAMLWPVRERSWRYRAATVLVASAVAAACLVPWFAINYLNYGAISPLGLTSRLTQTLPMPVTPALLGVDVAFFLLTYWTGEPLGALPFAAPFVVLASLTALMAAAGVAVAVRRLESSHGQLLMAIAATGGIVVLTLFLPSASGFDFLGPGRYAYPALPATGALMALGIDSALRRAYARRALSGFYGLTAAAILVGGALGLGAEASPPGSGVPPTSADVVTSGATGQLEFVSIEVDRVALDGAGRATWLHVNVTNAGSTEVEWNPAPTISVGGETRAADYARSTHLAGDVESGQSISGWIYVPVGVHRGDAIELRFSNVALDGYRKVGDVVLQFSV